MYLLGLVLASIAENLHDARPVLSNFLQELEPAFEIFWCAICEDYSQCHRVFNGLCAALALVCKTW